MPCMPPSFKDPDVYSEEILNLNYAVDDGRFEYSSKLEEQISVQALPHQAWILNLGGGWNSVSLLRSQLWKVLKERSLVSRQSVLLILKLQTAVSANLLHQRLWKISGRVLPKNCAVKFCANILPLKFNSCMLSLIDLRTLIKFKRHNKIKALGLPARVLREYIDHQCPVCHTMKRRHPKRPSSLSNAERCNFIPWQTVYVDTSGRWRSKSSRSNRYHTVFVCARSGFKLTFPHKKRSHFPLVYMKFVARIGSHPQHLISDKAGENNSKKFDSLLLAKGCQHICLPKGEHYILHYWMPARLLLFVIHRLLSSKVTPVLFLISLCFHRQDASVFATEKKSSEQMSNWMRKMNLEYF